MIISAFPMTAFAENDENEMDSSTVQASSPINFSVKSVKGVSGKTVHVDVRVSENSYIASLGIELLFDSSKLLVTSFEAGELVSGGLPVLNGNVSDKVVMSYASMEPITNAGTLFSVDFKITSEEINDILDLGLNVTEVTDVEGNSLISNTTPGTVEIVDTLYGDLTLDNRVTALDALKVLSHVSGETVLTGEELKSADVNGDGNVTVSDALMILYFSAELINDFSIYNIDSPKNLNIDKLDGYQFTISWDYQKDVLGYNVYLDGEKINSDLLTDASVTVGVNSDGEYGDEEIPNRIHDKIAQVTKYNVKISAVNSLKESEKSDIDVTTKRVWSWVTFKDWDGTIIKTARVYYGDDAIVPNNPTRENYFFTGWDKETTNIITDTVITATYEDAHYNFIFNDENGNEIYRQDVTHDGCATPPAAPDKKGYTFDGWYTEKDGGEKINDFTITTAERVAYAHYVINTYNATFDSMGGSSVSSVSAEYMTKISKPTNPTRLGFGFAGWYKDKACTKPWNFGSDVLENNVTLYAKWTPVTIEIDRSSLSFNSSGATTKLNATVKGGTDNISWYSDNPSVATVDNNGNVTAKGHGTAWIYVKGTNSERRPVTKVTVNIAKTMYVTDDDLRIRSQPNTSSKILGYMKKGAQVTAYGSATNGWYQISYKGINGYASGQYLSTSKPTSSSNTYVVSGTPSSLSGNYLLKINELKKKMPNGYYWRGTKSNPLNASKVPYTGNYYPDSCCPSYKTNNNLGYYTHNGRCSADGCCGCGVCSWYGATSWSCMGYTNAVVGYLYGKSTKSMKELPCGTSVKAGDALHVKTGSSWGHWIFVVRVYTSNGKTMIDYTDANGSDDLNKIRWASSTLSKWSIINVYRA